MKFQKDDNGETALTLCAKKGDQKTMQYLLVDLELDIKQTGEYGRNLFHIAVTNRLFNTSTWSKNLESRTAAEQNAVTSRKVQKKLILEDIPGVLVFAAYFASPFKGLAVTTNGTIGRGS